MFVPDILSFRNQSCVIRPLTVTSFAQEKWQYSKTKQWLTMCTKRLDLRNNAVYSMHLMIRNVLDVITNMALKIPE